jgi:hypothetical protein
METKVTANKKIYSEFNNILDPFSIKLLLYRKEFISLSSFYIRVRVYMTTWLPLALWKDRIKFCVQII